MRALSLFLAAWGCVACREPPAAGGAPPPPNASVTAPAGPVLASEVTAAGLRVRSGSIARGSLWGYSDLGIDLDRVRLDVVSAKRGALLPDLLPEGALAIVNGGYFEADFKPSTWLKSGGAELSPRRAERKGGVLAVAGTRHYIGDLAGLSFEPELAVQSFPLIVEPGARPGIHRDDGRRAARTVACVVAGQLHLIVIAAPRGDGPTLYEADALLRKPAPDGFGCNAALNLDGGPSSGVVFGPRVSAKQRVPVAPVAYGIALAPR